MKIAKRMKRKGNSCHDIVTLRELRNLRHANETAKKAAAARVKNGVTGAFSMSCLFVTLVRHYAPANISRVIGVIFRYCSAH